MEYEDNQIDQDFDLSRIHRLDDTTYTWHHFRIRGSPHNRVWTVYAQDSWRLGERITFNAGLRWDGAYLIDYRRKGGTAFYRSMAATGRIHLPGEPDGHSEDLRVVWPLLRAASTVDAGFLLQWW